MAYSGSYFPENPKKYRGDPTKIVYRSLWERNVMVKLDTWDNILEWSSEEIVIPYRSPIDEKLHRYFPDFWVRMINKENKIITLIAEVKPMKQKEEPKKPKRVSKRYITEVMEYGVNQAKWNAAREYCKHHNMQFIVLTEKELFGANK